MRLPDKTALVTGAGSGIGRAIAIRFAEEGARVAACDIDLKAAQQTAEMIGARGHAVAIDISKSDTAEQGVEDALEFLGGLDVLVNAAGVFVTGAVYEMTEAEWDKEVDTNLKGTWLMCKAAWPALVESGRGSIVNITSGAAYRAVPAGAAYCAAKAGSTMLTRCIALDGAPFGIRANCIPAGFIDTPMLPLDKRDWQVSMTPLGKVGEPEDVALAALYFASDDASWVTGAEIAVDGGLLSGFWSN